MIIDWGDVAFASRGMDILAKRREAKERRADRERRASFGWFNWYIRHHGIRIDRLSEREAAKLFRQWSHRRAH